MVKGQKYLVRHKSGTQRVVRESVMVFLDEEEKDFIFSARPVAGTQTLPKDWVREIEPVPEDAVVYINRTA